MIIEVYAILKEYFEKEVHLEVLPENISALRQYLALKNPAAEGVLKSCRFAVEDAFVGDDYQLKKHDIISIIPPSSGG